MNTLFYGYTKLLDRNDDAEKIGNVGNLDFSKMNKTDKKYRVLPTDKTLLSKQIVNSICWQFCRNLVVILL